MLLGVLYYNDTLFGFLPTRATWDAGWQELADSFSLFRTTVAPVPSDGGFAVAIALGTGLCAYLADAFAFRAYGRVEAIVPSGLLFVTASALGTDRHRLATAALWLACVVVTVALLRAAHGESTTAWLGGGARSRTIAVITGAATLAIVAMIAGTVIGPRLPGAEARALIDTKTRDSSGTQSISPLVDVQARLVNRSNTELFTVTSSLQSYWRLTTLSEFNGQQFGASEREYIDTDSLDASEIPQTVAVRQQIRIASLGSFWVPAAADPVDVSSTESLLFHSDSSTIIRERGNLYPGLGYTVTSVVPTFTAEQLRAATASNPPGEQYRSLPDDFNQDLRNLAATATAGAATPYDQAVALQNYFRTNFTYNVNVSRGHSIRSIEAFINAGEGYCEQFSVSFAALARTLGLPTRVGGRVHARRPGRGRHLARARQACPRLAGGLVRRRRLGAVRADPGARRAGRLRRTPACRRSRKAVSWSTRPTRPPGAPAPARRRPSPRPSNRPCRRSRSRDRVSLRSATPRTHPQGRSARPNAARSRGPRCCSCSR